MTTSRAAMRDLARGERAAPRRRSLRRANARRAAPSSWTIPGGLLWAVAVVVALVPSAIAVAAEWGGVEPGASTIESVRARWGAPSKETKQKVEGYDTVQWVYEGARAPDGLKTMTVDFGLLAASGYKPTVVRLLTIEPNRGVFGVNTVIQGWGEPDGIRGRPKEDLTFFYESGLLVFFDKEDFAYRLVFSLPQAAPPAAGSQPAPPAGAPTQRR